MFEHMFDGEDGAVDDLATAILTAARTAFAEVRAAAPPGGWCGYALYSDDGAMTVCLAANAREHLAAAAASAGETAADAVVVSAVDTEWSTAEWSHEGIAHEHFDGVHELLDARLDAARDDDAFGAFRDALFEACVRVLETLVAEGAFGPPDDHVVVFTVSDGWSEERDRAWVSRLNPPAVAARYPY